MSWISDHAVDRLREAAESPDLSGTRYRLGERIGRGGMGVVFLAEDQTLGRRVALKVLNLPDAAGDFAARLLREACVLARLEHPGIVPVHDAGTLPDGRVFYAMKYVEGSRLDEHARQLDSLPGRLRLFQRICEAVAFAHSRGVLHRDLKPENVMVGPFGEVLVMDWGVAKVLAEPADLQGVDSRRAPVASATASGAIVGTAGYMSPEQARGESATLDQRTDVYALGKLLEFLLCAGKETPAAPLAAAIAKATRDDRAGRYASASDLAADVGRYLDGLPLEAYPDNLLRRVGRLLRRHQVVVWLVVAYVFMRVVLILLLGR